MASMVLTQCGGAVITALIYPFGYAKVLMQVGHEPFPPIKSRRFWSRREVYQCPNILRYIGHIRSVDGYFGLYRGLFPKILAGAVGNMVQSKVEEKVNGGTKRFPKPDEGIQQDKDFIPWMKTFVEEASRESLGRCCAVIISHPFHVIMVRSMVQFIGREVKYNSVFSSIREVYSHDGILGFFSGLIPRLIGEIISIWATGFLVRVVNKYLIYEKDLRLYSGVTCGLLMNQFTYKFTLVSNVMIVNGSGLSCGQPPMMPHYTNWLQCMRTMSRTGELKRGATVFWRIYIPRPDAALELSPDKVAKISVNSR